MFLSLLGNLIFFSDHPIPESGTPKNLFLIGKVIGIGGRLLGVVSLLAATVAFALFGPNTLLFAFISAYFVVVVFVLAEVTSALLMFGGNWLEYRQFKKLSK